MHTGVLEPVDFTQGHWVGSVTDTEKALDSFYQHCAAAGPSGSNGCSLATNGSIAADIRERFQTILTKLYHNPFPVQAPYGPEVMTYSVLKGFTFSTLYSPVIAFRILSDLFRGLEGGDVAAVADLMVETGLHRKEPPKYAMLGTDAGQAVECADADPFDDYDTAYWQQYYREINGVSPLGGGLLTSLHLRCAGWKTRNVRNEQWGGNTSTPILWIGNTADPICPIKSAFHQAEKFPGSVVLTHDTTGHCSIAAYSHCTTAAIRAYFHNGTLPEPDTVCGVTQFPFDTPAPGQKTENSSDVVVQDVEIAAAHGEVQKAFIDLKMGYGMPQL